MVNLLAAIRAAGFVEVEIAFSPQADNNPFHWPASSRWTSFHESYFQENWNLIFNVMPIIRASGIPYRVDLGNELSPPAGQSGVWNEYARKLWINFNLLFNKNESLGFSIPGDFTAESRIANLSYVYGGNFPHLFDVHIYGDAYNRFNAIDHAMDQKGFLQGLIIGETYYNDRTSAIQLSNAIAVSDRPVHFLTQWPLTKDSSCSDVNVLPLNYDEYIMSGF